MSIDKKQLMKLIKDDMEKYKNTLGRSLAGQFRDELTLAATNAMGALMSAGVTPEILEAWPMEAGMNSLSFWRASLRRLPTSS